VAEGDVCFKILGDAVKLQSLLWNCIIEKQRKCSPLAESKICVWRKFAICSR